MTTLCAGLLLAWPVLAQQPPAPPSGVSGLTGALTNINQNLDTKNFVIGNPTNVAALNSLISSNFNFASGQIREALMPTLATTPTARNLPLTLFETYANTQEKEARQVQEYVRKIADLRTALAGGAVQGGAPVKLSETARSILRKKDTREFYMKLPELSKYEFDGGLSQNLFNRVKASLQAEDEMVRLDEDTDRLAIERKKNETLNSATGAGGKGAKGGGGSGGETSGASNNVTNFNGPQIDGSQLSELAGKLYQATRQEEARLAAAAKMGLNEVKKVRLDVGNRQQFREYIANLFATQQYLHAVLAMDFYRAVYADGDYPTELSTMYNLSLENLKQARAEVEAFKYKYENQELAGASERLLAAFIVSRNAPEMLTVPREQKRKVSQHLRKMSELESLLTVKDFDAAEGLIRELKRTAGDFDFNKAMAMVNLGRQRSHFALGMAKMNMQQGKLEEAQQFFYSAGEIWPNNPELAKASTTFFTSTDARGQAVTDFDRFWTEENWRGLYEGRLRFAVALADDPARAAKFEKALKKVEVVETAIAKSGELGKRGDKYGAWEALESASRSWPNDSKLNRLLAESSSEAADFVKSLKTAQQFEAEQRWGSALAWYLSARNLYPASDMAGEGIEAMTAKILPSDSGNEEVK
ncbi:MAG: hypothetical protein SFY92_11560 [Verrucomicrobiae bacterium]|nr:hypothetical protein [Verrucomicrobiae bacterium]